MSLTMPRVGDRVMFKSGSLTFPLEITHFIPQHMLYIGRTDSGAEIYTNASCLVPIVSKPKRSKRGKKK